MQEVAMNWRDKRRSPNIEDRRGTNPTEDIMSVMTGGTPQYSPDEFGSFMVGVDPENGSA